VVFPRRSEQLAANIPGSALQLVQGAGHMVHHAVPSQVARAVESVADASGANIALARSSFARSRGGDVPAAA
jgi:hypothetical protein